MRDELQRSSRTEGKPANGDAARCRSRLSRGCSGLWRLWAPAGCLATALPLRRRVDICALETTSFPLKGELLGWQRPVDAFISALSQTVSSLFKLKAEKPLSSRKPHKDQISGLDSKAGVQLCGLSSSPGPVLVFLVMGSRFH